jgi:hypothetical protein
MQQMLDRLGRQTYVGGKRVAVRELPSLPKQAAVTGHSLIRGARLTAVH